jgi:hypothetical protein
VTNQLGNINREEQWSKRELDFMRRWRQLVDQASGQSVVARKLNWATSTVSRDYNGDPLPRKERLVQLCRFLEYLALRQASCSASSRKRALPGGLARGRPKQRTRRPSM